MKKTLTTLIAALILVACNPTSEAPKALPQPHAITEQSKGYYCTMNLAEHNGGKAQIFLESKPDQPIWFSTVNQAFGFTRHPGEPKDVAAVYVTDMGKVTDWNKPNADNAWINAKTAHYVIDTKFVGGMGTVDALPFADLVQAQAFVQKNGGKIVSFDQMPDEFIYK
ncbi:nitrous oxide reductase accessory protein NosL [Neisseriaceae bacterium B1]